MFEYGSLVEWFEDAGLGWVPTVVMIVAFVAVLVLIVVIFARIAPA